MNRLLAALTLAGALLLSSAGVASAQNWSVADPKGDVVTLTGNDDVPVPAPNRRAGDVWRTSISHTDTAVVVRVTMRAVPSADWFAVAAIRTPRGDFELTQTKIDGIRQLTLNKITGDGGYRGCTGKSSRIIGTALQMVVPRRCLGRPGAVRVGVGVAVLEGEERVHADDALRVGLGGEIRYSPLIRRG